MRTSMLVTTGAVTHSQWRPALEKGALKEYAGANFAAVEGSCA